MGRKKNVTLTRKRLIVTSVLLSTLLLSSCSAVRTITNTAESKSTEDGTTVIQTKIVESYVGTKDSKF